MYTGTARVPRASGCRDEGSTYDHHTGTGRGRRTLRAVLAALWAGELDASGTCRVRLEGVV